MEADGYLGDAHVGVKQQIDGFGLGTGTVAEGWTGDAILFWNQQRSGSTRISQTRAPDSSKPKAIYSLNGTRRDTLQ